MARKQQYVTIDGKKYKQRRYVIPGGEPIDVMEKRTYMILDTRTGLWARKGSKPRFTDVTHGKVWPSIARLRAHLIQMMQKGYMYNDDCVLVRFKIEDFQNLHVYMELEEIAV